MTEQLDILHAGSCIGKVQLIQQGLYLHISANCRFAGTGVQRLYLHGENGSHLLGVMRPEGTDLLLDRTVSLREYRLFGLGTPKYCGFSAAAEVQPNDPQSIPFQWVTCEDPCALFADRGLAAICPKTDAKVSMQGESIFLALPLDPGAPFPLLPVFRFGHTENICGRNYVVFELNHGILC